MKTALVPAIALVFLFGCRGQPASTSSSSTPVPETASATPAGPAGSGPTVQAQAPTATPTPVVAKPVPPKLPELIATIDDDRIERWELEGAISGIEARAGAPIPAEKRDEIVRGLIDQLVAYHVLVREAHDRKLASTEVEFEGRMSQIKGGFPNDQAFQDALKARGLTLDHLQRQTKMSLEIDKVIEAEVVPKISIDDAAVGAFYQQNAAQFAQAESVHASHILIATPQGATPAQKQEAKAKSQQLLKQVKSGGDFAELARQQSQDSGSAPKGGDLGFFPKGQTDPAFELAAFALKPGELSNVVETPFGYHVIKVTEHRAARTAPLQEVSGQIKEYLTGQQRDVQIQAFIQQAKGKRKVKILI